jgi:hypothetical protein
MMGAAKFLTALECLESATALQAMTLVITLSHE